MTMVNITWASNAPALVLKTLPLNPNQATSAPSKAPTTASNSASTRIEITTPVAPKPIARNVAISPRRTATDE